jgi:secretion/DNA translocation related TadE-like protein
MRDESGSATVYVISAVALLAAVSLPVAVVANGFAVHRRVVLAADLSALGGAQASLHDQSVACRVASQVAVLNGASLQSCTLSGSALTVEVKIATSLSFLPEVSATARAGVRPQPSP